MGPYRIGVRGGRVAPAALERRRERAGLAVAEAVAARVAEGAGTLGPLRRCARFTGLAPIATPVLRRRAGRALAWACPHDSQSCLVPSGPCTALTFWSHRRTSHRTSRRARAGLAVLVAVSRGLRCGPRRCFPHHLPVRTTSRADRRPRRAYRFSRACVSQLGAPQIRADHRRCSRKAWVTGISRAVFLV